MAEPEDVVDRGTEPIVASAPRVGLVAPHHRRPLLLAHRAGPGIGQQIDVDVVRMKVEDIVSGFLEPLLPFRLGEHANRFNDLDPIGFVCLFLSHSHSFRRPVVLARTREPPRASRRGPVEGECCDGRSPTDSRYPEAIPNQLRSPSCNPLAYPLVRVSGPYGDGRRSGDPRQPARLDADSG